LKLKNKLLSLHTQKKGRRDMYAIVEIAGKQYKAEKGRFLYVDLLNGKEGDKVTFDRVLLTDNGGTVNVGAPTTGTSVSATILKHKRADKVIVFKKKRRKGYKVKNGHRQSFTQIQIDSI
jgi:large subunit ribosomal protein L21